MFDLFNEFGVENCKFYWIKDYPCNSKKELEAEEGKIQKENQCVNKYIAGRTLQLYRDDFKEKIKENNKVRYQMKKLEISEINKQKRQDNPDEFKERDKQAYPKKKAMRQRPYQCDCGVVCKFHSRLAHFKSNKHQQYLQNQNNPQE